MGNKKVQMPYQKQFREQAHVSMSESCRQKEGSQVPCPYPSNEKPVSEGPCIAHHGLYAEDEICSAIRHLLASAMLCQSCTQQEWCHHVDDGFSGYRYRQACIKFPSRPCRGKTGYQREFHKGAHFGASGASSLHLYQYRWYFPASLCAGATTGSLQQLLGRECRYSVFQKDLEARARGREND